MSLSSTLATLPLSRNCALGILFALLVSLFLLQTFVTRKDSDMMVKILHSYYPKPESQLIGSLKGDGNTKEDRGRVAVDLRETSKPYAGIQSRQKCRAKSHIVFLKTHQTESSTIQHILYRYGGSSRLTFALPKNNALTFSYPELFQAQFVEGVRAKAEFDIMCNEMRFRKSEVAKVMPKDTFYFSILRHPVLMMQSMFMHFKYVSAASDFHTLDKIIQSRFKKHAPSDTGADYLFTNLTFDFGFDNIVSADGKDMKRRASEVIGAMERDFHLILINEYFDESLVLLKHVLCWSLEDVATFRFNRCSDQTASPVLPDTAEDIRKWNDLDWRVYQYFNATFWKTVESTVGIEEMKREVSELRELQVELLSTCLHRRFRKTSKDYPKFKTNWDRGDVSLGFSINKELDDENYRKCQKYMTPEVQFTSNLYDLQFSKQTRQKKQAS